MRLTDRLLARITKKDVDSVGQLERLLYAAGPVVVEERGGELQEEEKAAAATGESLTTADLAEELRAMFEDVFAPPKPAIAEEAKPELAATDGPPAQLPVEEVCKNESLADNPPTTSVETVLEALERSYQENKALLKEQATAQLAEKRREWEAESAAARAQLQEEFERQVRAEVESLHKVFSEIRSNTLEEMKKMGGAADAVLLALESQKRVAAEAVAVNQRLHTLLRFSRSSLPLDWREQLEQFYSEGSLGRLILDKSRSSTRGFAGVVGNYTPAGAAYEPLPYADLLQSAFVAPAGGVGAHLVAACLKGYFLVTGHVPIKVLEYSTQIQDAAWNVMCIQQAAQAERAGDIPAAASALSSVTNWLTTAVARHWLLQTTHDLSCALALRALAADAAVTARFE